AHGPAIMASEPPPTRTRPTETTESSWWNSRLASLNGLRMGSTCSTPGMADSGSAWSLFSAPVTPMIVRSSPWLSGALKPSSRMRSRMWSICSRVEWGRRTMIMAGSVVRGHETASGSGAGQRRHREGTEHAQLLAVFLQGGQGPLDLGVLDVALEV